VVQEPKQRGFGEFAWFSLLLGFLVLPEVAQADSLPITMVTTENGDHSYRSSGEMILPFPGKLVSSAMGDLDGYNLWAPRGQDGRDAVSAAYIGQLTGVRTGPGILDLVYRINLFWPFGSSGQTVRLGVSFPQAEQGALTRIHFLMKDPSFAILRLEGDFSLVSAGPESSLVKFDSDLKLAWFLRPFFPLEAYRTHVVNRIKTALESFAQEVASRGSTGEK